MLFCCGQALLKEAVLCAHAFLLIFRSARQGSPRLQKFPIQPQRFEGQGLNQLNYTMSRTCPQCEGRIVSSLDTNARNKKSRQPKPNEQLRKLRPGMWRDEKQAATRMPGSKEAPAQKQGSYAPDGSGHNSQQPATATKLQLRNSGFPKAKL